MIMSVQYKNTPLPENELTSSIDEVKSVLNSALQLGGRTRFMDPATPLLGSIPELDSMAVVHLLTALEEHFGFVVADDEIGAETFATVGSLCDFVDQKLAQ
jgi:acyl carrier protein